MNYCPPYPRPALDLPLTDVRVADLQVEGGQTWASEPVAMVAKVDFDGGLFFWFVLLV